MTYVNETPTALAFIARHGTDPDRFAEFCANNAGSVYEICTAYAILEGRASAVRDAWANPGQHAAYHEAVKARVAARWPSLANAIDMLVRP